MRKEPFIEDNYYHIYNRGNRKAEITRTIADKWRFMQALRFFNDTNSSLNIFRNLSLLKPGVNINIDESVNGPESVFEMGWPVNWPERNPLVKILCYSLLPNHFHLLLKEIIPGGIIRFMHKLGTGYAKFFNIKYQEVGRLFQGPYKSKLVEEENYLKYLCIYIQVINILELFPGGLEAAFKNFSEAIKFLNKYPFSSHSDYAGLRNSLIIDKDVLSEFFVKPEEYKKFTYDVISTKDIDNVLRDLNDLEFK